MSQFHPDKPHAEILWLAMMLRTGDATPRQQQDFAERLDRLAGKALTMRVTIDAYETDQREQREPDGSVVYLAAFRPFAAAPVGPGAA